MTVSSKTKAPEPQEPATLAVLSVVFGIISLLGGFFMGIPAIILAAIALKKNLPGRGLSIAGLVTGICGTVFMILSTIIILLMFNWVINTPEVWEGLNESMQPDYSEEYRGART